MARNGSAIERCTRLAGVSRRAGRQRARRGTAVAETAITLMAFLTVTMGMMDLGVGVFRFHVISQAARHVARRAMVHGALADQLGTWGPGTITATADTDDVGPIDGPDGVRDMLIGCNLENTQIDVQWPNGNELGDEVIVTVTTTYQPVLTWIFPGASPKTLTAVSKVRIAH